MSVEDSYFDDEGPEESLAPPVRDDLDDDLGKAAMQLLPAIDSGASMQEEFDREDKLEALDRRKASVEPDASDLLFLAEAKEKAGYGTGDVMASLSDEARKSLRDAQRRIEEIDKEIKQAEAEVQTLSERGSAYTLTPPRDRHSLADWHEQVPVNLRGLNPDDRSVKVNHQQALIEDLREQKAKLEGQIALFERIRI